VNLKERRICTFDQSFFDKKFRTFFQIKVMEQETRTKPFVVSVEGNIGSGKSSMLKCFENMSETVTTVPGNLNVNVIIVA
jgi:ABC-type phosphate transport system ATPase subunit